jgi:hypothetical protein
MASPETLFGTGRVVYRAPLYRGEANHKGQHDSAVPTSLMVFNNLLAAIYKTA